MKKIISVFLCLAILFVAVGCGEQNKEDIGASSSKVSEDKVFRLRTAKYVANFDDEKTVVICWGDSITQGMAMAEGFTYPQHLQGNIGSAYRVINAGVPGETSNTILSRANAIEICLSGDVVFDKGEKQYTLDRYMFTVPGESVPLTYKGFGNQLKLSSVIIGGKKYTIEFESGETYDNGIYRLTREDTSEALTIPAGTKVQFDYSEQYEKVHCNVILIGANDGNQGAEDLIKKYKKLAAQNENFIAVVPFYSTDYSKEFAEAFGEKALNVREYFMNSAHKDYGIELTELDERCIEKGMIPGTYNYKNNRGDCHLNEKGYLILGEQIYKKGVELGYWK